VKDSQNDIGQISWLQAPFISGIRPPSEFKMGIEVEQFMESKDSDLKLVQYFGNPGVATLLNQMQTKLNWEPTLEGGNIIGLNKGGNSITIEPSGAVEISTTAKSSLAELHQELATARQELLMQAEELGLMPIYSGLHPHASKDALHLVPKKRYDFMYPYMGQVGSLGQEMMKLTASVQVAIDYSSEPDAMRKLRLCNLLTPYFIAISANSRMYQGNDSGYASYRSHVWSDTDNSRSGFPDFLDKELNFQAYIDWALEVPVYFLYRNGVIQPEGKRTFRQLIDELGDRITPQDWETHLSTLFPWVRLRNYLEIRSFDLGKPEEQIGYAALVFGLMYSEDSLVGLEDLLGEQSLAETRSLTVDATKNALSSTSLRNTTKRVLSIAERGLPEKDRHYLEALKAKLAN
jgi:glutamate--cysteine ligase